MPWLLAIDTGGTFTDCVATSPAGVTHRVKVLSSSAVRARVVSRPDASTIITDWTIPSNTLTGCTLAPLDASCHLPHAFPTIIHHDGRRSATSGTTATTTTTNNNSTITLSAPLDASILPPDAVFEARSPWQPPILAARIATATPADSPLPPIHMRLATTRGTNALLERRGHAPLLFITRGFADLLDIGDQTRPDLFALDIIKPAPLHHAAIEVDERLAVDGSVLTPLDLDALRPLATAAMREHMAADPRTGTQAPRPAAIALMHAWRNPAHEHAVAHMLRQLGFTHVCTSASLSPLIGFLPRTQSAVVNAYLSRIVGDYLAGVESNLGPDSQLLVMTSAGGLSRAGDFHPKDSLLSGPAGGLLGAADAATSASEASHPSPPRAGEVPTRLCEFGGGGGVSPTNIVTSTPASSAFDRLLTFDMGGTSTDVARCTSAARRDFPLTREHRVADARIMAPAVAVESVAAGGGSICSFHNGELRVGPESAGANPGPACYGAGGPLTITDCHLLLGRLAADRFAVPISFEAARAAALKVLETVNEWHGPAGWHGSGSAEPCSSPVPPTAALGGRCSSSPTHQSPSAATGGTQVPALALESLLEGFLALADERMADAIRRISIRQGEDPASYTLLAFGGAGGLHACALAQRLGISTVLIPPDAGLLSARGLSVASIQRSAQRQTLRTLDAVEYEPSARAGGWLVASLNELSDEAAQAVAFEGIDPSSIRIARRIAAVRVQGQSATLDIPADDPRQIPTLFAEAYQRTFGHSPPPRPLEIESLLVVAESPPPPRAGEVPTRLGEVGGGGGGTRTRLYSAGAWHIAPILTRHLLTTTSVPGPALLADPHATTYIPPGWSAAVTSSGAVILNAHTPSTHPSALSTRHSELSTPSSPIALELFIASLSAIASDMGETLRRTALSVNVKERLDFSCALLSPAGELLVNAPHIPVHLGALGLCVRALQDAIDMRPGDTIITNHPGFGGSHLPDITLVTPIHLDTPDGPRLIGYAASRAHHAEIGGIKPGSMPPGATRLSQEGVIIPPTHLVERGTQRFDAIATLLQNAPHPTRALEHNIADLRAALAANTQGLTAMRSLFERTGFDDSESHCRALTDRAESRVRAALARITPGTYRYADTLDDGSPIAVTITIPPEARDTDRGPARSVLLDAANAEAPTAQSGDRWYKSPAAIIDFTGTAPIHPRNFNATPAIATAAVLYVLRLLVNEPMPLNEGMLRAIDLRLPEGSLLNPGQAWSLDAAGLVDGPAVAAGNVETSQRVVDVLLLALGLAAASQGTMNNLAFGDATFGFYETICGGAGATPNAPGASAAHTHMTNTRITDAEILEQRLPVRVRRFAIRHGSGGQGQHPGGDGVIREIEFLTSVDCSVLAQRRLTYPPGLHKGGPAMPGRTTVVRPDAREPIEIHVEQSTHLPAGCRITVETPGGGAFTAVKHDP